MDMSNKANILFYSSKIHCVRGILERGNLNSGAQAGPFEGNERGGKSEKWGLESRSNSRLSSDWFWGEEASKFMVLVSAGNASCSGACHV